MKEIVLAIGIVGAGAVAILILERIARAPVVVAGIILIHGGAELFLDLGPVLALGSITVYLPDVVYGLVAGGALIRVLGIPRFSLPHIAVLSITGLALFSVARGALAEDVATAVNEFRVVFYFFAAAAYFITVEPTKEFLEKVTPLLYTAAVLILGASVFFWGVYLAGATATLPDLVGKPHESGFRVVTADRALILAQACLIALLAWQPQHGRPRRFERALAVILIPAILLLQWKVVWVLFIVGLVIYATRDVKLGRRLVVPVVGTAAVGFLALTMVFAGGDAPSFEESLGRGATTADTFLWRVEGWRELTDNGPETSSEVLMGAPYGRGWERTLDEEEEVTSQPHSFYLDNYLRHGLIALVFLIVLYLWAFQRLVSRRSHTGPGRLNPNTLFVLLATQLVFYVTFSPSAEQGMLLGIALSVAFRIRRTERAATLPETVRRPAPAITG